MAPRDTYSRFQDPNNPDPSQWTGYGSSFRNNMADWYSSDANHTLYWNDYGRPMAIKMSNPQSTPSPGIFYPWTMPYDSTNAQAYCDQNGCQSPNNGAQWYQWNISHCNPVPVTVSATYNQDTTYLSKPGNMIGPDEPGHQRPDRAGPERLLGVVPRSEPSGLHHGLREDSWWATRAPGTIPAGRAARAWRWCRCSTRTRSPTAATSLSFNNLAVIFIEGQQNAHAEVDGRFLFFAKSTGPPGPTSGSLIKKLQLVE